MKVEFEFECDERFDGNFCKACQKEVIDLSKLTEKEVETVLEREDELCVKATYVGDKLQTRPAPPAIWKQWIGAASIATFASCAPQNEPSAEAPREIVEQEERAVSKLKEQFNLDVRKLPPNPKSESAPHKSMKPVDLSDALSDLAEIQAKRNDRHNLVERKEGMLKPLTYEDGLNVFEKNSGPGLTLVSALKDLELVMVGRPFRKKKSKHSKKRLKKTAVVITKNEEPR